MQDIKTKVDAFIAMLLSEPEMFQDGGVGEENATVLNAALVRPIFIDTSCLLYRLAYAKADTYHKDAGDDDGLLAHMICTDVMRDVAEACNQFACAPVLCFDSKENFRTKLFPQYKEKRHKSKVKLTEAQTRVLKHANIVRNVIRILYCPMYNIQSFCVHGYESDDLIAAFVLALKQKQYMGKPAYDKPVVFMSSDHDLHQLLLDDVYLADVRTGILVNASQVEKHTGVRCDHVVAMKTLGGCKSDEVPGVSGCGEVSVKWILENSSSDVPRKKTRESLQSEEGLDILRRNLKLVKLPFVGEPPMPKLKLLERIWPVVGVPDKAVTLFKSFGIPESNWPVFNDVTLPRPKGAVPMCSYKRKEK